MENLKKIKLKPKEQLMADLTILLYSFVVFFAGDIIYLHSKKINIIFYKKTVDIKSYF